MKFLCFKLLAWECFNNSTQEIKMVFSPGYIYLLDEKVFNSELFDCGLIRRKGCGLNYDPPLGTTVLWL